MVDTLPSAVTGSCSRAMHRRGLRRVVRTTAHLKASVANHALNHWPRRLAIALGDGVAEDVVATCVRKPVVVLERNHPLLEMNSGDRDENLAPDWGNY